MTLVSRGVRLGLRGIAIVIAVAGAVDPVVSVTRPPRTSLTIVTAVSADNADASAAAADALRVAAGERVEIAIREGSAQSLGCGRDESCVVITDGSIALPVPPDRHGPTSMIRVAEARAPNVAVVRAVAGAMQHPAAMGSVGVDLMGEGVAGRKTDLRVFDGDVLVGSATYEWASAGAARVSVPWWPVSDGPRRIRVEAVPAHGESSALDNAVDVGVTVDASRIPVLVFDPRPSWGSTFVRRALEADPRLTVDGRARLGPKLSAGTAAGHLDERSLESADAVVVGAPDALTATEVDQLDRYVRVRGGLLVLVPDRRPDGPAARWFGGGWTERLVTTAEPVGQLQASEILDGARPGPVDVVLARSTRGPTVVLSPRGAGRVIVSGAMDAWRFRAAHGGAFDRFWTSLIVDGARESARLSIELGESVASPGADVPIRVRWRTLGPPTATTVRAVARCGSRADEPVRLWPTGEHGVFDGFWRIPSLDSCVIDAAVVGGPLTSVGLAAAESPARGATAALADLERLVTATTGERVRAGQEATLLSWLRAGTAPVPATTPARPLRSPWWMLAFAACLGGEWWLRRRAGLR